MHKFEEPCISGEYGSGTVFFSNCNLSCVFCQNYEISNLCNGREIGEEELADIFLKLEQDGAENINLVSPTIYRKQIINAVRKARVKGLALPIVYNTNGYETVEGIKELEGIVDVYLPDLKYSDNELAYKYSKVNNYFEIATKAIKEMEKQVGEVKLDEKGMMKKGLIVRHLVLPSHLENTIGVLNWFKENMAEDAYMSIMTQYFPTYKANEYNELKRKVSKEEYQQVEDYIYLLGIKNGYMQDYVEEDETQYVPKWDY